MFKENNLYFFTDGGCENNGKKDSIGAVGISRLHRNSTEYVFENLATEHGELCDIFSIKVDSPTNNTCELLAILRALRWSYNLKQTKEIKDVVIFSDSAYCINGITEWCHNWRKNGWDKKGGLANKELWQELYKFTYEVLKDCDIKFYKVKGHVFSSLEKSENFYMNKEDSSKKFDEYYSKFNKNNNLKVDKNTYRLINLGNALVDNSCTQVMKGNIKQYRNKNQYDK